MTNREFLTAIANSTSLSSDLTEFATEQIAKMDARNEAIRKYGYLASRRNKDFIRPA